MRKWSSFFTDSIFYQELSSTKKEAFCGINPFIQNFVLGLAHTFQLSLIYPLHCSYLLKNGGSQWLMVIMRKASTHRKWKMLMYFRQRKDSRHWWTSPVLKHTLIAIFNLPSKRIILSTIMTRIILKLASEQEKQMTACFLSC